MQHDLFHSSFTFNMSGRIINTNRHKKVVCLKCFKEFRSDYLKSHLLVHEKREKKAKNNPIKRLCTENISDASNFSIVEEPVEFIVKGLLNSMVKTVEKIMLDPASDINIPDQSKIGEIEAELIRDNAIFDKIIN